MKTRSMEYIQTLILSDSLYTLQAYSGCRPRRTIGLRKSKRMRIYKTIDIIREADSKLGAVLSYVCKKGIYDGNIFILDKMV